MITPQFSLNLNRELFVDNFAGGGGASTGIERALGRHVDHAINHDKFALGMHRINHPQTVHHCEDVFDVDPRELTGGLPIGGGWFSPDCKHFSKAKGGKPLSKKIRGLAFVMLRYAKYRTRVIYMENVEEIQTWGPLLKNGKPDPKHKGRTWNAFKAALSTGVPDDHPDLDEMLEVLGSSVTRAELVCGFGYHVETRELRACDYRTRTIRKRLFMVARCDGQPIVWPEPTHAKPELARSLRRKPWRPIAECIDWDLPCHSIFLTGEQAKAVRCKRPLAKSTLKRIATGINRYVLKSKRPFLVSLTHQGGDRVEPIDEPGKTITGAHRGEKAVVTPFLTEHSNATHQRNFPADEPGRTQCAEVKGGHFALVAGSMVQTSYGERDGQAPRALDVEKPLGTVASGGKHAVIAAHMTKFTTGAVGSDPSQPIGAVTAGSHSPDTHGGAASTHGVVAANLVKLRGDADTHTKPKSAEDPIDAISAGGTHHGVVTGTLVGAGGPAYSGKPRPIDKPSGAQTTENHSAVAMAFLAQNNSGFNRTPHRGANEPLSTIVGSGAQQTIVAANTVAYYGNDKDGQGLDGPARTVTTKERFGLVESELNYPMLTPQQLAGARVVAAFLREHGVEFEGEFATVGGYVIVDIGMRMLTPRELFRAQGFPDSYIIDKAWLVDPHTGDIKEVKLTKEQQIRMCGNSVCPDVAEALVRANNPEMAVWNKDSRKRARALAA